MDKEMSLSHGTLTLHHGLLEYISRRTIGGEGGASSGKVSIWTTFNHFHRTQGRFPQSGRFLLQIKILELTRQWPMGGNDVIGVEGTVSEKDPDFWDKGCILHWVFEERRDKVEGSCFGLDQSVPTVWVPWFPWWRYSPTLGYWALSVNFLTSNRTSFIWRTLWAPDTLKGCSELRSLWERSNHLHLSLKLLPLWHIFDRRRQKL